MTAPWVMVTSAFVAARIVKEAVPKEMVRLLPPVVVNTRSPVPLNVTVKVPPASENDVMAEKLVAVLVIVVPVVAAYDTLESVRSSATSMPRPD